MSKVKLFILLIMVFLNCTLKSPTETIIDGFKLTVAVTPAGSGVIEILPLKDYYENGEIVNIIAIPNTGRTFYKWHGDLNSYDSSISIIINSDKEIVADIPFFVFDNGFVVIRVLPDTICDIGEHAVFRADLNLPKGMTYVLSATLPVGAFNFLFSYGQPYNARNLMMGAYPITLNPDSAIAGSTNNWVVKVKKDGTDSTLYNYVFDYHVEWR